MIEVSNITKVYRVGDLEHWVLKGISLSIERGEFVVIMGPSGSGKSTFMNILGCLDTPTSGTYRLEGMNIGGLGRDELSEIRNKKIGFVFQNFNLIPRMNALENVELPLLYNGVTKRNRRERAKRALELVGLKDRESHYPNQLSGGQQPRVAIARALVNNPAIILADEPTGNLDTASSEDIMALFSRLNAGGITIIIVTHEPDVALYGRRVIRFRDGMVIADERRSPSI
ncbi:MAG: ABC transporter ATP-binding protein [Syntrophobacterales bacterium]|nr:ABC transporter ATP-binding protein [Syntrophobacterales bacterium]